jgi:hypothetical protein
MCLTLLSIIYMGISLSIYCTTVSVPRLLLYESYYQLIMLLIFRNAF